MKKPKKFKKPKLPKRLRRPIKNAGDLASKGMDKLPGLPSQPAQSTEEKISEALSNVPQITNETVGEHREEVLSSARKYIYPLQHSKHRVVKISLSLFLLGIIGFFAICGLELYKFQNTSGFIYDVTRIVPFPVAKTGGDWVSYESYLFELRRNMHYYQTQQQADFSTKDGKTQLSRLKQQAMAQVIQDSYVKQLAEEHNVSVSDKAVDNQLALVRSQNRLGNSNRVFRDVLKEFWGWSEADFKRELKQQMLAQAVVAKLDTATNQRAQTALKQLQGGEDFAKLAGQVSDDPATKPAGGQYPNAITVNDSEMPPAITAALFKLQPNQVSGIVNPGYSLEILKVVDKTGNSLHAAHIQFTFKTINTYVKPLQAKEPPHKYIKP